MGIFPEHIQITDDGEGALRYISVDWLLPEHINLDSNVSEGTLAVVRLKVDGPSFNEVLFDYKQPRFGEIRLSIDNKNWHRHLYIDYLDLTYGDTTIFYKLVQTEDLIDGDGFPELVIDVYER
jgi:hypothetical protein